MTDLVLGFLLGLGLGAVIAALVGAYCYILGARNEVLRDIRRLVERQFDLTTHGISQWGDPSYLPAATVSPSGVTRPISQQQWEAYQTRKTRESGMTRPAPPQKPSAPSHARDEAL